MQKNRIKFECEICGKECDQKVSQYQKSRHHFCSFECKTIAQTRKVECVCEVCGKTVLQKQADYDRHRHHYCSMECSAIGTHRLNSKSVTCEWCGKEFTVRNSVHQRFCSMRCQNEWQKTLRGEVSPNYHRKEVECEWCHKKFFVRPYKMNDGRRLFCCKKCRQDWYAIVWSQTDEWREESRFRAARLLAENKCEKTNTAPQVVVNRLLDSMDIRYENEHTVDMFSIDNYLTDYGLTIEVMGDFWHCSVMKYKTVSKPIHIKNVNRDRMKRNYVRKKNGSYSLYLWEHDVMNNQELCSRLIKLFVENCGKLDDYNSFNYHIADDGIALNEIIVCPYQEMSKEELKQYCAKA